jgi:hypothetical protein
VSDAKASGGIGGDDQRDGPCPQMVMFVADSAGGWLLWNTDSDMHAPEQAVRLVGQNSLAAFDRTDLM